MAMLNILLAMALNFRHFSLWVCVLLVLIAGPMQAYALVLCDGCEGEPGIKFSKPDGSCASCPLEDLIGPKGDSLNHGCACVDQPLPSHELAIQQLKYRVEMASLVLPIFCNPLQFALKSSFIVAASHSDYPLRESSLTFRKSVVLLI